ncbi:MAG: ArsR family transcriptional regulator [Acidobacteria bacterium]|nr:MAG: ArsR family transcriptional regulator [Acidobacteriota bacterium]MCE7957252.1 ArsR family transcriptional regulator [Acidobacteria bacterium ACB2]
MVARRPLPPRKELLLGEMAEWLKAMADPMRLRILHALKDGERCVNDLLEGVGCSQANVSKHLSVLRHAGLVGSRRDGVNVYYRIADPAVFVICETVCDSLERTIDTRRTGLTEGRVALKGADAR